MDLMKSLLRWLNLWLVVGMLILAGCSATKTPKPAPVPPTEKPAATSAPTGIPSTPTPTPALHTATPTPAYPDVKTDPRGALQYAEESALFRTATFTETTTFRIELNDSAAQALDDAANKDAAEQLEQFMSRAISGMKGIGVLEVVDAKTPQANYYYRQEMQVAGQLMIMEMIQIDKASWMRSSGDAGRWEVYDISTTAPGSRPYNPMERLSDAAVSVSWLKDETINGEDLRHIRVTLDPQRGLGMSLLDTVAASANATSEQRDRMLDDLKIEADVWLIADSLRIRQQSYHVEVSAPLPFEGLDVKDAQMRLSMDVMQRFDNFDQPVDIKAPVVPTPAPSVSTAMPTTLPSTDKSDEGYSDYVRIQDSTGALTMEVPVEWDEVDGNPWVDDSGEILGASLTAAPVGAENGPLAQLLAAVTDPEQFNADTMLDNFDFESQCTQYDGRADYNDEVYTGRIDRYSHCGDQGAVLRVVVAAPEDRSFLTILVVLALNEADLQAADRIFGSFAVLGKLPGMSVP